MANELQTAFIFDDKDGAKIDALSTKLVSLDNKLNSLGQNPTFGQGITTGLAKGSDAVGKLGADVDSLKTKVESFAPQPTISRYYENEERVVKSKLESIAGSIDKAKASINPLTRPDLFSSSLSQPNKPAEFGKPDNALYESVHKTRLEIQKLNGERLDAGKLDGLTRAGARLHGQLAKTQAEILRINNTLKRTSDKTVIDELNNDLVKAQDNFDKLSSRQQLYEKRVASSTVAKSGANRGGRRRGGISDGALTALELVDDFVPAGFNRPFNAAAKGMLAVNAVSMTTLATFGAIGAAAYGIVKVTENIRTEAERRLKVEERIAGAINNQIISQRDGLRNLQKMRDEAQKGREFSRRLDTFSVEDLRREKTNLERLKNLMPVSLPTIENGKVVQKPNESFEKISQQLLAIDAQIDAAQQKNIKTANDSFNLRGEIWKKSQEDLEKAEERRRVAAKKRAEDLEKAAEQIKELGKKASDVFDSLYKKSNQDNPFVQIFSEGDKALRELRENIKGLPADMQASAIALQQKINANALFSTRIDNNLESFDLRERARSLRNPQQSPEEQRKYIEEVARRAADSGGFFPNFGGSLGSYLANQAGGFDKLTDNQRRDVYETRMFGNFGFTGNPKDSAFNNLNANSLQSALASDRIRNADTNLSLNERLKKQIDIIGSGVSSAEERAIADRKLLSLSSGLNPNEINSDLRNKIASAAENEAARRDVYERENLQIQKDKLAVQNRIADNGDKLLEIAKKDGIEGLKTYLEIVDKTNGKVTVTGAAASNNDTRSYYDQYEDQ